MNGSDKNLVLIL